MKLPRPYIPLSIRLEVAFRQCREIGFEPTPPWYDHPVRWKLAFCLGYLFPDGERPHLDHNPPLMLRKFSKATGTYNPDANDPRFLIYRSADQHRVKTYVRGDGAQRSDVSQRRYLKRVARNRKPRRKFKWPKRKLRGKSHASKWLGTKHESGSMRISGRAYRRRASRNK